MAGNQLMRQLKKPPSPMELQPTECSVPIPCPVRQVSKVAIRCCTCSKRSVPGSRNEDGSTPFHRTTGPQVGLVYLGSPTLRLRGRGGGRGGGGGDFQEFGQVVKKNTACLLTSRDGFGGRMVLRSLHSRWQHGAPTGQRLSRSETRHAPPCPGRSGPDRPLRGRLGGDWGPEGAAHGKISPSHIAHLPPKPPPGQIIIRVVPLRRHPLLV